MKINLLDTKEDSRARRTTVIVAAVFALVVGSLSAIGAGASYRAATHGTNVLQEVGGVFPFAQLQHLGWGESPQTTIQDPLATPDNRLNILLLGIGGEGHEGSLLTDTIIFASIDRTENRVGLVSIPRDLAYPLEGGRFQKINAVNANFESAYPGEGTRRTSEAFAQLFTTRIDRYMRIDFKGFESLIDVLGGIDVTVEKSFTDSSFPTEDDGPTPYKWKTVSFEKGPEHMNGQRALTYVRSRHGTNGEGSDFARSRRQQIVLKAIRERLLSLGTLANPKKLVEIWTTLSSHIDTNLSAWDMLKLTPLAIHLSPDTIMNHVLTDAPKGELIAANVNGSFLLFPRQTDWSEIRRIIANPFTSTITTAPQVVQEKKDETSPPPAKPIIVHVQNGTFRTGLAARASTLLVKSGYTVAGTANALKRDIRDTVMYDLTGGAKDAELVRLKQLLGATISTTPPDIGQATSSAGSIHPDFIIILGESSAALLNQP